MPSLFIRLWVKLNAMRRKGSMGHARGNGLAQAHSFMGAAYRLQHLNPQSSADSRLHEDNRWIR